MNSAEICQHGTKWAGDWLRRSGYEPGVAQEVPGGAEVEADHPNAKILVLLKIAIFPAVHKPVTPEEARAFRDRAAKAGRRPYAATLTIDSKGQLVIDATWQAIPR